MKVGVLDVQGDVTEHIVALKRAVSDLGLPYDVCGVKTPKEIGNVSALVIPGGESTTISMLSARYGMDAALLDAAKGMPVFGTCAGLVFLCKEGAKMKNGQKTLGLLDARVVRNAFGRQRDSFETQLNIPVLGNEKYPGVFIRAPAIEKVWGRCKSLCRYGGHVVLARQDNILASAFHPELTQDRRLHEYFLGMI
ncbi:MAG: pyridoxal 5'-phosphate synthase glutaminase subunit PdxT [Candidatus Altiarchaeota archaeon]|nr:pyridoxal 5'-phosphate synthase glutaminase subunit PdxT [Candidatus Altiarchaeota archaeon]